MTKNKLIATGTFQKYYKLEHIEDIMDLYRSDIRSLKLAFSMISENLEYSNDFWNVVGNISECELYLFQGLLV